MPPAGAKAVPIDRGLVARLGGAVKGAIRGARDAWFGPSEPLPPVAPPEVRGRQWDYPVAVNVVASAPRHEQGEQGIDFPTLRALADPTQGGFDLLRLAIEKRKNELAAQRWTIRKRTLPGQQPDDGGPAARKIEEALRFPDQVNTFAQWARMLDEDLLVIDAPCVYLAPSLLGYKVPQVMDGGTLRRLIRQDGRTPLPPDPAFLQILHGLPAVEYSLDELVYMPRNQRSHRLYGMSPVEQVVMTVNIALRRQLHQLEHYTEGNIPDLLISAPQDWTPPQIKEVQQWFDTLSGDTASRRRMRMVPGGLEPFPLKESPLKDEWDEWLARIISYCFDLSPQALVKEMNRATAQTGKQAAQEAGLEPLKLHRKDFMDAILAKGFGAPELEYAYLDEEIADPEVKATVFATALGKGGGKPWMTQDEVRAEYGKAPMTAEQKEELQPAPPEVEGGGAEEKPPAKDGAEKVDSARQAAEAAELRARADGAAAIGLAVASGMQELAKAVRVSARPAPAARSVTFTTDEKSGRMTGAKIEGA